MRGYGTHLCSANMKINIPFVFFRNFVWKFCKPYNLNFMLATIDFERGFWPLFRVFIFGVACFLEILFFYCALFSFPIKKGAKSWIEACTYKRVIFKVSFIVFKYFSIDRQARMYFLIISFECSPYFPFCDFPFFNHRGSDEALTQSTKRLNIRLSIHKCNSNY